MDGLHSGELTDTSTDCCNVKLLAPLHVGLNGGKSGGAGVGVHDSPEGLEGAHHGRFRVRHLLLSLESLRVIENGLDDDQGARAQRGEEGADGDGPEVDPVRAALLNVNFVSWSCSPKVLGRSHPRQGNE